MLLESNSLEKVALKRIEMILQLLKYNKIIKKGRAEGKMDGG